MDSLGWGLGLTFALALGVLGAAAFLIRRRYVVVSVRGASMEPAFRSGDRVVVRRVALAQIRAGDVVVLRNPRAGQPAAASLRTLTTPEQPTTEPVQLHEIVPWVIKRVRAVPGDAVPRDEVTSLRDVAGTAVPPGRLVLLGDNAAVSIDSRQHGYYNEEFLLGIVVRRSGSASVPPPRISRR
ncbi:S26 family signal peptidase [Micromonospora okii]|uniref:S26 family signal peptidase n=1 Tax=Micromonospora okii TaxID=1182970 RepID=UPI001E50D423|nr:S26 family signal peptidase [Micromonospora okii]